MTALRSVVPYNDAEACDQVSSIKTGSTDRLGETIDKIYHKHDRYYAVYCTNRRKIAVAYSNDQQERNKQVDKLSELRFNSIVNKVYQTRMRGQVKDGLVEEIAWATKLSLEGKYKQASKILNEVERDVQSVLARNRRIQYLSLASLLVLISFICFTQFGLTKAVGISESELQFLLITTGAGAVGALFSIGNGIRRNTVDIRCDYLDNAMSAGLRVVIGIISAAVVYLVLSSGCVTDLKAGGVSLSGQDMTWKVALLVGFAAGFLERLVPDLLEKSDGRRRR